MLSKASHRNGSDREGALGEALKWDVGEEEMMVDLKRCACGTAGIVLSSGGGSSHPLLITLTALSDFH